MNGLASRKHLLLVDSSWHPVLSADEIWDAADYFGWSTPLALSITSSTFSSTLPTFSLASPA